MSAKKAQRWGVHYRLDIKPIWSLPRYAERSSFVVRGRTIQEARAAAETHPLHRGLFADFALRKIEGRRH